MGKLGKLLTWLLRSGFTFYMALVAFGISAYSFYGIVDHLLDDQPLDWFLLAFGGTIIILSTGFGLLLWKNALRTAKNGDD